MNADRPLKPDWVHLPRWLQGMIAPTMFLWLYTFVFGIGSVIGPGGMSPRAELVSSVALPLVIAAWVMADARKRGVRLCYDFDSFVFLGWPVVVPVYLFQTRGFRAFLTLLCFVGIWLMAALTASLVFVIQEVA